MIAKVGLQFAACKDGVSEASGRQGVRSGGLTASTLPVS